MICPYFMLYLQTMRKGLNIYLKRFQYRNTITSDLWHALEEVSGEPVGRIFNTWTNQQGYPIIIVSRINIEILSKFKLTE